MQRVCVVSYGGMVLWEHDWSAKSLQRDPINGLIHDVLLEDRAGEKEYVSAIDDVKVKWVMATEAQFFVVAVFQRFLHLLCIEQLLSCIKDSFISKYGRQLTDKLYDFEEVFAQLYEAFEANEQRLSSAGSTNTKKDRDEEPKSGDVEDAEGDQKDTNKASPTSPKSPMRAGQLGEGALKSDTIVAGGRVITRRGAHAAAKAPPASSAGKSKKPVKQPRKWDGAGQEPEPEQAEQQPSEETLAARDESVRANMLRRDAAGNVVKTDEHNWSTVPTAPPKRGLVATWLRSHFGSREVDVQDFSAIIPKLREKLITKNVAVEVAEEVCKSVEVSVRGTKLGHFDSLSKAIEKAMVDALHRILQPKTEVNILRSVAAAKERHRPYSIVFCGVNGVGKSTSLSKIAYWLQQNGHSVMIAAGDTFRSGAVEQLRVHGRCLDIPVFQMGYGTVPSTVAAEALQQAAKQKTDVVLIDTAGRMQDHESRMLELARLIHDNQPDLVLFVGEALVGNNGIDQLRKFNSCLHDFTPMGRQPRGIDGIVLTKFDTIDDKVGAAVSMVYECGQPIVFVGVGQTYQDLKTMEADVVVDALML